MVVMLLRYILLIGAMNASSEGEREARVMFGDPFGNRGDYSKGIFYGGRRSILPL